MEEQKEIIYIYIYISDAVTAIFTLLLKGEAGQKYNIANSNVYVSIREMAETVAHINGNIKVITDIDDRNTYGYAPELHINLDTTKIKNLGWDCRNDLMQILKKACIDNIGEKDKS